MEGGAARFGRDGEPGGRTERGGALTTRRAAAWASAACLFGCAGAHLPPDTGPETSPARQPDGVFVDVPAGQPPPRAVAVAGGVVSLTLPVSRADVQTLVHGYFRAFVGGELAAFRPLLAPGARRLEEGAAAELTPSLAQRLRAIDYSHLAFESLAAYDQLRVVPFEAAPDDVRASEGMRDGDVLVDVPVRVQRASGVRVFGSHVVLVLRRAEGQGAWQIAAVRETDGPWS